MRTFIFIIFQCGSRFLFPENMPDAEKPAFMREIEQACKRAIEDMERKKMNAGYSYIV